jgi:hypothetical protein
MSDDLDRTITERCEYCGGPLQEPGHFGTERHRRAASSGRPPHSEDACATCGLLRRDGIHDVEPHPFLVPPPAAPGLPTAVQRLVEAARALVPHIGFPGGTSVMWPTDNDGGNLSEEADAAACELAAAVEALGEPAP